jgi:hypothetical protein
MACLILSLNSFSAPNDTVNSDSLIQSAQVLQTGLGKALAANSELAADVRDLRYYNRFLIFIIGALGLMAVFVTILLLAFVRRNMVKNRKIVTLERYYEELAQKNKELESVRKELAHAIRNDDQVSLHESIGKIEKEKIFLETELMETQKSLEEERLIRSAMEKEISGLLKKLKSGTS